MEFITVVQDSSGPFEVTKGMYEVLFSFDQATAPHGSCLDFSIALLDMADAAWSDSRVTTQTNTVDGTTSILVDRSSPQPEF